MATAGGDVITDVVFQSWMHRYQTQRYKESQCVSTHVCVLIIPLAAVAERGLQLSERHLISSTGQIVSLSIGPTPNQFRHTLLTS